MSKKRSARHKGDETACARYTLSDDAQVILQMIAEGGDYSQLRQHGIQPLQVMNAARQALALNAALHQHNQRHKRLRRQYPRAYDQWCADEEKKVVALYKMGKTLREIAAIVERKPTAVKDKLLRLGAFRPQ